MQPAAAQAALAAPVLSTWDDESGLEDLDLDQLVSQHRNKATPSGSASGHSVTDAAGCSQPSVRPMQQMLPQLPTDSTQFDQASIRPAAAAASASVRSAAQTQTANTHQAALHMERAAPANTSHPGLAMQHAATSNMTATAGLALEAPKYAVEHLGLQGVNERLVDLSNLIIDCQCEPRQMAVLQEERKHLLQVQKRLKAAASAPISQLSTSAMLPYAMPSNRMQHGLAGEETQGSWPQPTMSSMQGPSDQWQANTARQQQPSTSLQQGFGQSMPWDQAAVSASMPGNPWEPSTSSRQNSMQHAGSSSFKYDEPDTAYRDDLGMPVPDPTLRQAAAGVEEGFVTCHQHDGLVDNRWDKSFEWSSDMQRILEMNFGTKTFRANQRQAINASIDGKDVFVLMPTGGGVFSACCSFW